MIRMLECPIHYCRYPEQFRCLMCVSGLPAILKPKVVALCGSSRHIDIISVCAWLIERDENAIVMSLHLIPHWYSKEKIPAYLAEHECVKEKIDTLHLRKIDLADEIFVVNYQDYIGISTKNEVSYAKESGKTIRWFTQDDIGKKVTQILIEVGLEDKVIHEY